MRLKSEQQRLYQLMSSDVRCFVRVCDSDEALWVSDLPRKMDDCESVADRLSQEGFTVRTDHRNKLWYIDWSTERWSAFLDECPCVCPALPQEDVWHEVYALCRLLLLHPAPLTEAHMPAVRRTVKLISEQPIRIQRAIREMHMDAARCLRKGRSVAHAAGRILADWLHETV